MLAIQVPTWIRVVAAPMSWAVAITSLLTSAAKIASKPACSASCATALISAALQPAPGITANAIRSAIIETFHWGTRTRSGVGCRAYYTRWAECYKTDAFVLSNAAHREGLFRANPHCHVMF